MMHIADNIKRIRKLLEETQAEFVKRFTNVSVPMLKSYESGKANPSILFIGELANFTGITEKVLVDGIVTKIVEKVENKKAPASADGGNDSLDVALRTIDRLTKERDDLSSRIDYLTKIEEVQNVKIVALETFLLQLAVDVRKTSLKDQSVAFGKIEGAEIRRVKSSNSQQPPSVDQSVSDGKKSKKNELVER